MSKNCYRINKSGDSTWLGFHKLLRKAFQTNVRENPWLSHFLNSKVLDVIMAIATKFIESVNEVNIMVAK